MGKKRKTTGNKRAASADEPAVVDTPHGPLLIYRLACGKIGVRHPPEFRMLTNREAREFRLTNPTDSAPNE